MIYMRFMRGTGIISDDIEWQEKVAMPFTPSHVEARTLDGQFYIGAHLEGGTIRRPIGYDKGSVAKLPDGYDKAVFPDGLCDMVLELEADTLTTAAFYADLEKHIGEPYDWKAILGFLIPEHEHITNAAICSARQTLSLRACGWFATPLASPAHLISPRDLLLLISGRQAVPGI